jgi:hypothetical protein
MKGREILYDDNEPIANDTHLIVILESFSQYRCNEKSYCRAYKLLGIHLDENLSYNNHMNKFSMQQAKYN